MVEFFKSQLGVSIIVIVVVIAVMELAVALCMYLERKVSAWIQDRHGPNRVGPWGLLQSVADGLKAILKEDIIPAGVDRFIFLLAPMLSMAVATVGFAVIPWGGYLEWADGSRVMIQAASIDIGLLYILAVGSVGVYGVVLGGWSSNNKYSFYGSMRAAAQMISYEIPMGLAILVVVLTSGHLRLESIVADQVNGVWNVLLHPVAFLLLLITLFAETHRTPFDLAEAEQELVGGYHTEYSALKFAMFFLGEYTHMIVGSALVIALFLGGYHLPLVPWTRPEDVSLLGVLCKVVVFTAKIAAFIFLFMWVRWTIPRFRFDQLMRIAWKSLVPLGLGLIVLTIGLVHVQRPISVWAPLGDLAVLLSAWALQSASRSEVTGRQPNLTPVRLGESESRFRS
jgi:NADH-quinone oxidoreductase subunit H